MATLVTESWTGATGAAWPSQWTISQSAGSGGSSSIQSNTGYMTAGTTSTSGMKAFLSGMSVASTAEILVSFTLGAQTLSYFNFQVCADNTQYSGNAAEMPNNGYTVNFNTDTSVANGSFDMWKMSGGSFTQLYLTTTLSGGLAASTQYTLRFQQIGGYLRFRLWPTASSEPVAWTATAFDSGALLAANRVAMTIVNNSTTTQTITYDNLSVSDATPTATLAWI